MKTESVYILNPQNYHLPFRLKHLCYLLKYKNFLLILMVPKKIDQQQQHHQQQQQQQQQLKQSYSPPNSPATPNMAEQPEQKVSLHKF